MSYHVPPCDVREGNVSHLHIIILIFTSLCIYRSICIVFPDNLGGSSIEMDVRKASTFLIVL